MGILVMMKFSFSSSEDKSYYLYIPKAEYRNEFLDPLIVVKSSKAEKIKQPILKEFEQEKGHKEAEKSKEEIEEKSSNKKSNKGSEEIKSKRKHLKRKKENFHFTIHH